MDGHPLLNTEMLESKLDDPRLRVFDATLHFAAGGKTRSGRSDWEAGHIPGSRFVDLPTELSEPEAALPFTRPSPKNLVSILGQLGIERDSDIVVYSGTPESTMWATRLWWLLRSAGLAKVALLDGSLAKWKAEGRAISTEPCRYAKTRGPKVDSEQDESWWASQDEVLSSIGRKGVCTLNALPHALFTGDVEMGYRRPGRIAGSRNAPFTGVLDPETGTLLGEPELRAFFQVGDAAASDRVISYCGGGIAATLTGFALRRIGHSNVAVYDGSLNEWSRDPALPMEVGEDRAE
jgi:thiosulfate/3-mercaptopyruvate sulfurtransferase